MDLNRAFSFVFEDEDWIAIILLFGLTLLIPILGTITMTGLTLLVADRVRRGDNRPLPRSQDFALVLRHGLFGSGIAIYYSLPLIVISIIFSCIFFLVGLTDSETLLLITSLVALCLSLPLILLSLVIQPLTFAAQARFLRTGSMGAALRFGPVFAALRAHLSQWLVLWLLSLLCGFVASLGGIVFFFGVIATAPFAAAVFGHLFGQLLQTLPGIETTTAPSPSTEAPPASSEPTPPIG